MAKLSTTSVFGDLLVDGTIFGNVTGNLTGNASTATSATTANSAATWTTARTITIGSTGKSVNGSGNVSWTLAEIGAAAASHGMHPTSKVITTGYDTAYRTQTKGNTSSGEYLTTIRNDTSGVANAPQYGSGLAWGRGDTHGYLYMNYSSAQAYIGAGNADKLNWVKQLSFSDHTHNYAAASHGTHVTFGTTTPKAPGTAATGSSTNVSREDHVHPLQTSVSGNAGTATTLATARTLTIGNTGKTFNGSANVSWSLAEIGAAASSHTHSVVNRTMVTTPIYNASTGILVDFNLNEKSGAMVILKLYGNSYSGNPPIEAIYQFYDYAGGSFYNPTGSAISGQPITLKVYRVGGKIKAWFQQPQASCTFKLEVAYGNNSSTPNVTLSNAAEPTGATETITITPNRVYSAAYKPTAADVDAAPSTHSHNYLPLAGGTMTGSVKVNALSSTWVDVAKNSKAVISSTAGAGVFHPFYTAQTTNGSLILAGYQAGLQAAYITKANVDSNTNTIAKNAVLFNESGGGSWPGTVSAASFTENGTALSSKYAAASHGTHVTYATTAPKAPGTAAIGSVNRVAREDHVHPLQTSVSGNAGTATTLATARTLTIGNTGKSFNGSANVSWSLAEIGAIGAKTANGYEGMTTSAGADNQWIRTTSLGIIPYQSGGSAGLGTSSWPFSTAYATNFYGTFNGNATSATKLATARTIALSGGAAGTATSFDGTGNISIPVTSVSEAYLTWGGKNYSSSYGPIDAAMVPDLGANRLAFMPAAAVTVEYSTNGGSSWATYSTSDSNKVNLFNGNGSGHTIGASTATKIDKAKYMVRMTITASTAKVYSVLNKFVIYCSTSGSSGSYCTISARTQANVTAGTDTWKTFAEKVSIGGWSGYNVINTSGITVGTNADQYGQLRFTFGVTSHANTVEYCGLTIMKIMGFGGVGWSTPSTMAASGRMYTYDSSQNVTFPAAVSSTGFIEGGTALSSKYALASHGTHVSLATAAPKAPGTAAVGTSSKQAREDHVHPLQTSVSGNAGTATTLATARTLTIGNTGKTFNGSANVSWSLAEIGAAASSHSHTSINYTDTRAINTTAKDVPAGLSVHLKSNGTDGISDGGSYHPVLMMKPWNDKSGWPIGQLAVTQNSNLYFRVSSGADDTSWNAWKKVSLDGHSHGGNITAVDSNFANATITNYDAVMNGINTNINSLK